MNNIKILSYSHSLDIKSLKDLFTENKIDYILLHGHSMLVLFEGSSHELYDFIQLSINGQPIFIATIDVLDNWGMMEAEIWKWIEDRKK